MPSNCDVSELRIPTTYGSIAAKVWGKDSSSKLKVMCVHGWQDNAGTFDRLLPLLDLSSMYVLCIDLPGHGLSSHLPKGVCYTDLTWVVEMKQICDQLKWTQFSIIAHSMGANASIHFALLFPDLVERVITLDTVKPAVFPINELADRMKQDIENFAALEERTKRIKIPNPVFSYDSAIQALRVAHSPIGTINAEGAACLLKRAAKLSQTGPNYGYIFTRDYRLQVVINRKTDCHSLLNYFSSIKCELLIINGKNGLFTDRHLQKQFLELYSDKCKKFSYVEVEGDHYVHLTNPQNVAQHIRQFLSDAINQLKQSNV